MEESIIKQELDLNNLPEKAPQVWRDICQETTKLHRENVTSEEVDAICGYTWDLFRDTIKSNKSTSKDTSANENEDINNG